ncbi:uncharacterized protein LY89DRAFT_785959 [Mollisia scopiformis]|uniref:C2H2-type domain-containing protein n=1 Tax=Mollisia scopiformis TaxID=149040 RepID=A0A194WY90_MOLSC|nr:uncharacterized protein LY89DRAFT_785959 [Mollisia scopiformis]KUJ12654.1 hypothetical protein LY89DRAFT_785959 [Mollisia scopiformis]
MDSRMNRLQQPLSGLFANATLETHFGLTYSPRELWAPSRQERDLELDAGITVSRAIAQAPPAIAKEDRLGAPERSLGEAEVEISNASTPAVNQPREAELSDNKENEVPGPSASPLTCCGNDFPTKADYNRHKRYHDKPESCPHCPRAFGTTKDLNRHINDRHQRTKVYHCLDSTCERSVAGNGEGFPRKDNWRRHMRDVHGINAN